MQAITGRLEEIKRRLQAVEERLARYGWFRIGRNAVTGLNRQDGPRKAAAMTYFAVFSIFPFLLLLIALLSFAVDTEDAQARVVDFLSGFLPANVSEIQQLVAGIVEDRGVAAGFGVVTLLWSAVAWFQGIDRAVNEMWHVRRERPLVRGKLFALGMVSGIFLVMLLSWLMNLVLGLVRQFADAMPFLGQIPGYLALWSLVPPVVSLGLMSLVFLLLYRFSPMCDLTWGEVWRGALITAAIWEVVRSGFALYVTYFADFTTLYGPLGVVMAFLVWLYLAHMIILFGAQMTYAMRLESHDIHELANLRCALPEEGSWPREHPDRSEPAA